jgi:hypothetical protein
MAGEKSKSRGPGLRSRSREAALAGCDGKMGGLGPPDPLTTSSTDAVSIKETGAWTTLAKEPRQSGQIGLTVCSVSG